MLLLVVILAGTLAGCGKAKIDSFVIGTTMDIQSISRNDYYYNVLTGSLTHMALVSVDENGQFHPMMAEFSTKDAKTWTFKLKKGLTWHDGEKVTAEDVKFTVEYIDEKEKAGRGQQLEALNVLDNQTIEFVYKKANVRALNDLTTLRIIPEHIFETISDYAAFKDNAAAIGCGPYRFVRFDANAGTLEYEAYPDYIDGLPNIKSIIVKLFKNTDTMYMALKANEISMVYFYAGGVEASVTEDLKASGNITLSVVKDTSNPIVLVFNNAKEPVNTLEVRKAIAKGLDYDKARELFGSSYSTPANYGFVPQGSLGYVSTEKLTRDVASAKDILRKAGAVDSNNDGYLELNGTKLSMELLIRSDKPIYARVGELLQANLKEIGIQVSLKTVDVPTFRAMSEKEHSNTSLVTRFTAFGMNMGPGMGAAYLDGRQTTNAQGQVKDPAFAKIVDQLTSAVTTEEYNAAAKECQEYYAANVPAIALYWDSYVQAYNSKYDGFVVDGTFGLVNQATWFSIQTAKR